MSLSVQYVCLGLQAYMGSRYIYHLALRTVEAQKQVSEDRQYLAKLLKGLHTDKS